MVKPVLKWAGGKTKIIKEINERIDQVIKPNSDQTFIDLFTGGGSVAISQLKRFDNIIMNDINKEVINVYKTIRNNNNNLMNLLEIHQEKHSEDYYYKIRELDRLESFSKMKTYEKAARTIYLNKTCYNGLFRVNSDGHFNVPIGKPIKNKNIYEKQNFKELSKLLKKVKFYNKNFTKIIDFVKPYDIVYMDPPYDVLKSDSFVTYTKNGFTRENQKEVFDLFEKLTKKKVYVILSNSRTEFIENLYKKYINKNSYISVRRTISSKVSARVLAKEVLIDNFQVIDNENKNCSKNE